MVVRVFSFVGRILLLAKGASFDPDTIELLRKVLDDAWASLSPVQQARLSKAEMAQRILRLAASGERDRIRLRARALIGVVTPAL
ncbi:MAG TPA: hypothetical protein VFL51_06880 [Pseudolabrys sp.]|nr:hypothetical protein [Pseudolabrys sp.]